MPMRLPLAFALAFSAGAATQAPETLRISRAGVCAVTDTYFNTPMRGGPEAWDWPEEAHRLIAAHRWIPIDEALLRTCPSATIPVVGLAFSDEGNLVQITRSSYPLHQGLDGEGGSIDSCLLRRSGGAWRLVGCKLDMVS
jgi:hypothetical protein